MGYPVFLFQMIAENSLFIELLVMKRIFKGKSTSFTLISEILNMLLLSLLPRSFKTSGLPIHYISVSQLCETLFSDKGMITGTFGGPFMYIIYIYIYIYRVILNSSSIFGGQVGNRKRTLFHIGKHGRRRHVVGQYESG